METNISQVIDLAAKRAQYDEIVKEILSDKQVLARILKYTLDEFKDAEIEDIIANIGDPVISKTRMEPGYTNTQKVKKESEEDNVPGENKIFYDIRFSAYYGEELIKILVNIETQRTSKAYKLGYHLDNRIIYYLARMISSQKEVEFAHSDYDNLKAVRSIWICMDAANDEDSINRIRFKQDAIYGKEIEFPNIDKVQGIIIRLRKGQNLEKSKNDLIAMLEEFLGKDETEIKRKRLSEEFNVVINDETERRISEMCNLSQVLIDEGIEKGELSGKVTARYEDGMSIEDIAEKTQISIDEVKTILREKGLLSD
ncbi:hypothetical protein [Butyrivibrio sp. FC2001]|uniref:hypothetical protein n=1 Tax=Butyrivibrio sp. FC2001 TaxID=1280671 RepID=UPI0004162DE2|nr:hypothetical protein [Butyrivibrio sp. FC2001]